MYEADVRINGTLIWYYFICKREVWLISHGITADQEDENIEIGRFIHENAYSREKKEIDFDNFKVDVADSIDGKIIVQEVKKSSKFKKVPGCSFYSIFTRLKSPELMLGNTAFSGGEKKRRSGAG